MASSERRGSEARRGGKGEISDGVLELVTARFRVLAAPSRVRLLLTLEQVGAATATELGDRLPTTSQNVSHHLTVLHMAGLVDKSRAGKRVEYELADWAALWAVDKMAGSVRAHLESQQEQFDHGT